MLELAYLPLRAHGLPHLPSLRGDLRHDSDACAVAFEPDNTPVRGNTCQCDCNFRAVDLDANGVALPPSTHLALFPDRSYAQVGLHGINHTCDGMLLK